MGKRIAVFLMTNEWPGRESVCTRTIDAFHKNIRFEGYDPTEMFRWFVSVDGSEEYVLDIERQINLLGYGDTVVVRGSEPPGRRWNRTIEAIFGAGHDIYFRLENDFELRQPLDIFDYDRVLLDHSDVGMVRLGLMPIDLALYSRGYNGSIYFECLKSASYSYSGNPGLVHRRLHEAVGMFANDLNPGQIEVDFDHRYRQCHHDVKILWPLDLGRYGTYGPFNHIGKEQSYG